MVEIKDLDELMNQIRTQNEKINNLKEVAKNKSNKQENNDLEHEIKIKKQNTMKKIIIDEELEDEIAYYLEDYIYINSEELKENIQDILPSKDNVNYKEIILRLQLESHRIVKEFYELINEENKKFSKEDLLELKKELNEEQQKIKILKNELIIKEDETNKETKINNKILLLPTKNGNIRVLDELEHIDEEYYDSFIELFKSIENGTFKNVKRFTGNNQLVGICQVKGFKTRVIFVRLGKNTYGVISCFIKKSDNDKGYRELLQYKISEYRTMKSEIKDLAKKKEFIEQNDQNIKVLYELLKLDKKKSDELDKVKKLGGKND